MESPCRKCLLPCLQTGCRYNHENPDRPLTGINASSQQPPPQALAPASKGLSITLCTTLVPTPKVRPIFNMPMPLLRGLAVFVLSTAQLDASSLSPRQASIDAIHDHAAPVRREYAPNARVRGGKRQEQTQIITRAIGRPTHTAPPSMITISRSRP
jgi:hypothetical protein